MKSVFSSSLREVWRASPACSRSVVVPSRDGAAERCSARRHDAPRIRCNQKAAPPGQQAKRFHQSFRSSPIKSGCLAYGFRSLVGNGRWVTLSGDSMGQIRPATVRPPSFRCRPVGWSWQAALCSPSMGGRQARLPLSRFDLKHSGAGHHVHGQPVEAEYAPAACSPAQVILAELHRAHQRGDSAASCWSFLQLPAPIPVRCGGGAKRPIRPWRGQGPALVSAIRRASMACLPNINGEELAAFSIRAAPGLFR